MCSLLASVQGQPPNPQLAEAERLKQEAGQKYQAGRLDEAISLMERALALRERVQGKESAEVIEDANILARLYFGKGAYQRAEPLFVRVLAAYEKHLGAERERVAEILNNLAETYRLQGSYARALPLYQPSLTIYEKALGPEHPNVATALNNLAGLYEVTGDYPQTLRLVAQAAAIQEVNLVAFLFVSHTASCREIVNAGSTTYQRQIC